MYYFLWGIYMKKVFSIFLMSSILIGLTSCSKSFRDVAKDNGFASGMAVAAGDILDPELAKVLKENCSILVSENSMKWANLRPNKSFWNWTDIDKLIEFANENGMKVKWHVLFWHQQNSPFVSSSWTREQAISMMHEHIETVMTRYKGKIQEYEVVNEMFEENGSFRNNVWYKTIGPDYIEIALKKAREVDPNAKLYLNEFNNEEKGHVKADAMFNMIKDFKERGVPIDGVGLQLHLDARYNYSEQAIRDNVQRYADLGLDVAFTEIDVRIPTDNPASYEQAQEDVYLMLYRIAKDFEAVKTVITWGISDRHSWVPATFPGTGSALLYDKDLKPKKVYNSIYEELKK